MRHLVSFSVIEVLGQSPLVALRNYGPLPQIISTKHQKLAAVYRMRATW